MYREHAPSAEIRGAVACLWTRESSSAPHRVLPDGCLDLLLRRGRGGWSVEIVGTMTRAIVVAAGEHDAYVGARFHPGEAARLFGLSAHEVTDTSVPLDLLVPALAGELSGRIQDVVGVAERVALLDRVIGRWAQHARPVDPRVRRTVRAMQRGGGREGLELGIGDRQLRRLFTEHVGIGPRALQSVLRLGSVVSLAKSGQARSWAELALSAGYCEQSHLAREFRRLAGTTPCSYLGPLAMSGSSNRHGPTSAKKRA